MNYRLAQRVVQLQPSATIAVDARARELRAAGHDIIALAAGQPDFDTPSHIRAAAIAAIDGGQTRYTAVDGIPTLKEAICHKLWRDSQLRYTADQIIVSCGAKHVLFNLLLALLEPGDEVIIPSPSWGSYADMAALTGGTPVIVPANEQQSFKVPAEELAAHIKATTRLLILNSPCNPTGQVYSTAELAAIGEVLRQHPQVIVVSDEIYESIYWGMEPLKNLLQVCPDLAPRYVLINGVSKAYAMTGWRIGYAAGPAALVAAMRKIQGQSTTCPSSISQAAAAVAIGGDQACLEPMVRTYRQRHDFVLPALRQLTGVTCQAGMGTFYLLPSLHGVLARPDKPNDDVALATDILEQTGVALVPGSAFGAPGYLRLSFAQALPALEEAIKRLKDYLE